VDKCGVFQYSVGQLIVIASTIEGGYAFASVHFWRGCL